MDTSIEVVLILQDYRGIYRHTLCGKHVSDISTVLFVNIHYWIKLFMYWTLTHGVTN